MLKFLLYTTLFTVGGYAVVTRLPDSYKEKMLAAMGWGEFKGQTFSIVNPAAQREQLIQKLEENLTKIKELQNSAGGSKIQIEGPAEVAPLVEDSEELIEEIKKLNPKTGVVPKIMEKILGLAPPAVEPGGGSAGAESELKKLIGQLSPEAKALICQ